MLSRRIDGYHELESIFVPISFGDSLEISETPASEFGFTLTTENLLTGPARDAFESASERGDITCNTVSKALAYLKASPGAGLPPIQLNVHLKKRVPAGAGLGGGSSNAGIVLRFLRERGAKPESVRIAAIRAGADVPFFLENHAALATGVGEHLTAIEFPHGHGVLCLPDVFISTPEAYRGLKRPLQGGPISDSRTSFEGWQEWARSLWTSADFMRNDFEEVAFRAHPELASVKQAFQELGALASLTGSGSALYGILPGPADNLLQKMIERFPHYRFEPFHF